MAALQLVVNFPEGTEVPMSVKARATVAEVKELMCQLEHFQANPVTHGMRAHEFALSVTGDERESMRIEFAAISKAHNALRTALRDGTPVAIHIHPTDKKRLQLTYKGTNPTARLTTAATAPVAAVQRGQVAAGGRNANPLSPTATSPSTRMTPTKKSGSRIGKLPMHKSGVVPTIDTTAAASRDSSATRMRSPNSHAPPAPQINRGSKPTQSPATTPVASPAPVAAAPVAPQYAAPLPPFFVCLAMPDGALLRFQLPGPVRREAVREKALEQLRAITATLEAGALLGLTDPAAGPFEQMAATADKPMLRDEPVVQTALQQNLIPTIWVGPTPTHASKARSTPGVTLLESRTQPAKTHLRQHSTGTAAPPVARALKTSVSTNSTAVANRRGTSAMNKSTSNIQVTKSTPNLIDSPPMPRTAGKPERGLHELMKNVEPAKAKKFFIRSIIADSLAAKQTELRTINRDDELEVCRKRLLSVVGKITPSEKVELLFTRIAETPWPAYLEQEFLVTIHAPENCAKQKVTIKIAVGHTMAAILEQACNNLQVPASQHMLQVAHYNEFLHPIMTVGSVDFFRERCKKRKEVHLMLVPLAAVLEAHSVVPEPTVEYKVRMDHDLFTKLLPPPAVDPLTEVRALDDLAYNFQVKILETENVLSHFPEYNNMAFNVSNDVYFQVDVQLFHGTEPLTSPICTKPLSSCQFKEWVGSPEVSVKQLPRATKVCFTVNARHSKEVIAIGWTTQLLFDHRGHLRAGKFKLPLWPRSTANPIGTTAMNLADKGPMFLNIELPRFVDTPVLHKGYRSFLAAPTSVWPQGSEERAMEQLTTRLRSLVNSHPLYKLTYEERKSLWSNRELLKAVPRALPKVLLSADWTDVVTTQEAVKLLGEWAPLSPETSLQLLDSRFALPEVREFAVDRLRFLPDMSLEDYLLQLVQALKYEPYHDSALMRFLLQRALQNRRRIGHALYWHLKSELIVPEISERYGLILELYLEGCGGHLLELLHQQELVDQLGRVASLIKAKKKNKKATLRQELSTIRFSHLSLPVNPRIAISGINPAKCNYMDSFTRPLWVEFTNASPKGDSLPMIFKAGDDLRADILTLQMFRIMDKLWLQAGMDLRLSVYGCTSTGVEMGMIEVVQNATTAAAIQKKAAVLAGPFMKTPLDNWLREKNPGPTQYDQARENFVYSCAGYCVATYILGIGDRHNDNIMITATVLTLSRGHLFHIDFAHFLGNVQMWQGIKRERAPFVLTPEFVYVMGKETGDYFQRFIHLCCKAYNILRRHAHLFISLFSLMLSTGIPELRHADDINYLCKAFALNKTDEEASSLFKSLIQESLNTKATQVNFFIHNMAHLQT